MAVTRTENVNPPRTSFYVFPWDLVGEGVSTVLDTLSTRAGVQEVNLAVAYHAARSVHPRNPLGRISYAEPGALAFAPDPTLWRSSEITPQRMSLVEDSDLLAELCASAERYALDINAWVVFFRSDRLPFDAPDFAPRSAFDDPFLTALCPAHPAVQGYAHNLVENVSRYPIAGLRAESLHYQPWLHGFPLEHNFVPLRALDELLLGMCFCQHCRACVRAVGVDVAAVHSFARQTLERRFAAAPDAEPGLGELTLDDLGSLVDGHLIRYVLERARLVTALTESLRQRAYANDTSLTFVDLTGVLRRPDESALSIDRGWWNGIDASALAAAGADVAMLGYGTDLDGLCAEVDGYLKRIPPDQLVVSLIPTWPDCTDVDTLTAKVRALRDRGVTRVDFYNYGLVPESALDWVRQALTDAG